MSDSTKKKKKFDRKFYKMLYENLGDRKSRYITINVICILYCSLFVLAYSYMYKMTFYSVEYGQFKLFTNACILCITLLVCEYFSSYLFYYKMRQVRVIVFNSKMKMFHKLTKMDITFFEENHSGDTLKRLNWDANSLKELYFGGFHRVIEPITTGIVSVITMVIYNWSLSICAMIFAAITVFMSLKINVIVRSQNKEIQRKLSKLSERLSDLLSGFLVIKLFRGTKLVVENYEDENDAVREETIKRAKVLSSMEMLSFLTGMIGSFGTIAVGIYLVSKGMVDYGTIMAIVTLQLSLCGTLQRFGGAVSYLTRLFTCAKRVDEFMGIPMEKGISTDGERDTNYIKDYSNEKENKKPLKVHVDKPLAGIEINNLAFSYKDNTKEVFNDFNLKVLPGERVMLVGQSGCGKSTILKLLMGFYDVSGGKISIFGKDIHDYNKQELRRLITYVPQESYLFEGTIAQNIRYAAPDADDSMIISAAKMAYADEFINTFDKKYETMLTAGGSNLSGGQRQRVAIARAFLKDAPIILLDEPSSALDVESEGLINKAMIKLMKNKMVIMVTHRTTSFKDFDRCIQIKVN